MSIDITGVSKHYPSTGSGRRPATGSGRRAATGSGRRPSTGSGQRPATGSGRRPSTGSGQRPATGSGQRPATGSGRRPSTGSGRRADFVALRDINVSLPTGQLTALLGPSGGGKSTLLRIIAGLEPADSGSVAIEGTDATSLPPQKRNVGFVFQHYAVFKHMTVAKNVAFGLEIRKRPKAEVRAKVGELLELVHLSQFADRLPAQLSGGQRQRLALARALAVEPSVLLLDEPFGALDAQVRKELREWLRRLHDEMHVTTVFVTHDQEEALEVADEIVIINEGRIEQIGTPDQLYDEPANDFVMGFLGAITYLGGLRLRPHDIDVATAPGGAHAVEGVVSRALRVGFEVRLTVDVPGQSEPTLVVLSRTHARALDLELGTRVWLRPATGATSMPVLASASA